MDYFETQKQDSPLYNREVLKLLFGYVRTYRRYLFAALGLVLVITGSSVSVPYIVKQVIDRHIFKQGRVVYRSLYGDRAEDGIRLEGDRYFMFQSQLGRLSKDEKERLLEQGALSEERYMLIEKPLNETALNTKLQSLSAEGEAFRFSGEKEVLYLLRQEAASRFSMNEIFTLRDFDLKRITLFTIFIVLILSAQFGASYAQIVLLMRLSQFAMRDLRKDLMKHLLHLEVSYFDRSPIGRIVNRLTNDIETLNELFSSVLVTLFSDLLMMCGIAAVMFFTDLYLAGVVAATFPVIILLTILFRIRMRNAYRVIRTKITELNSFLNETITGIRIVQIFVRETMNLLRFEERNDEVYSAQRRQMYVYAVFRPLVSFLRWICIAAVIYFGARGIGIDRVSYGVLVMFIAYVERFFAPVQDLSEKFDIMQSATAAGEKIVSLFKVQKTESGRADDAKPSLRFYGRITFEDVWFAYEPGQWILKGVSFEVGAKQTLAIVGETGAGKSTIINLLSKFYLPQKGRILIDGIDIADLPDKTVRNGIATVMQDPFLFSRTVGENITLGERYEEGRFSEVTGATHTDRFISGLPGGKDEMVMERGSTFSQGQRQLLSFARALYFDPSVLVLDEATSSIDTETERLVQDAIRRLTEDRTSIIIAHRLSTVKRADNIIVIDHGRVVEEGTHEQLLRKRGIYRYLYALQFSTLP